MTFAYSRPLVAGVVALGTLLGGLTVQSAAAADRPAGVPKAGESPRIDQIIERGTLRIGVLASYPWLFRNKMPEVYGNDDPWRGSSWILAKAYAKALGVELELVDVSNETKARSSLSRQAASTSRRRPWHPIPSVRRSLISSPTQRARCA